ncbi:hypothetical protein P43SY_006035 [Pythium insidiosum]|uniref:Histone deacetylase domain-containing protein n=1 Tax=Pythium insidiosum TaxID=114742 RepID=A0AAD5LKL2_PYTIN|nr:hypothetical protein P43SY_006035 [Pythium insidiosum]
MASPREAANSAPLPTDERLAPRYDDADDSEDEDYRGESDDEAAANDQYFLHDLVEQGAIDRLRALLPTTAQREQGDFISRHRVLAAETALLEKDDMGCLPVHVALITQRLDCALHLLRHSDALTTAMLRLKCADLNTPLLHLALRVGAINEAFATQVLRALVGGPSPANEDEQQSLADRSKDLAAQLFEALHAKDDEGNSVVHLCAMFDLDEALELLLEFYGRVDDDASGKQAWVERSNRLGQRALHLALKFHSHRVARRLVQDLAVDLSARTSLKQTPAHFAALYGDHEGLSLLLKAASSSTQAIQSEEDAYGQTPLDIAKRGKMTRCEALLTGADEHMAEDCANARPTRFFYHPEALRHLPLAYHRRGGSEPPPENLERIETLVDRRFGVLHAREFRNIAWDYDIPRADIADILRVHEYRYVQRLRRACEGLPSTKIRGSDRDDDDDDDARAPKTFVLDPDTALSRQSYDAATRAAGAVCRAVDEVIKGTCTTAFCIVRPPGHHAGPVGKVTCPNDPEGSHGFCLLNNVAIGAAYARAHYKHAGVNRVAILDFDVHHGNGTEEIVRQLVPSTAELRYETPYGEGRQVLWQYKPWRDERDAENVFFCSVHGYGHKDPQGEFGADVQAAWFYPGSGATCTPPPDATTPLIFNVGMPFVPEGSSASRLRWRRAFRDDILPRLVSFQPDLIFLSSGFDAHKKEHVNWGYVSLLEQDYEWLVGHVKRVAQRCCQGRIISVLEGGYNFHGRVVSPFARSVAAHARALMSQTQDEWDENLIAKEAAYERNLLDSIEGRGTSASQAAPTMLLVSKRRVHETTATAVASAAAEDGESVEAAPSRRSKRSRKHVDYVALAEELSKPRPPPE